jgi:penicillin-binding protein 1A
MERGLRPDRESRPGFRHPKYEEYADQREAFEGRTPYVQGMFVALDPQTGAVRALVGGTGLRAVPLQPGDSGRRQPGSAFKTFVYASAIQRGSPRPT